MALSNFVLLMILVSAVVALGSLVLLIIMIWNYFKKKTIGTALLAIFFGTIAVYHVIHSLMLSYAAQKPFSLEHKIFYIIYVSLLLLSYYFLYVFANRHILHDNDVIKSIILIIMLGVNGAVIGIMGYELFSNLASPVFYVIDPKPEWNISHYVPATFITLMLYASCVLFVEIRIIIRLTISLIKKEAESKIHRKGLQMILIGILALFSSVLLTIIISIPNTNSIAFSSLFVLRGLLTLLGLFLSYIGWILPNWYIKRIRDSGKISRIETTEEETKNSL